MLCHFISLVNLLHDLIGRKILPIQSGGNVDPKKLGNFLGELIDPHNHNLPPL